MHKYLKIGLTLLLCSSVVACTTGAATATLLVGGVAGAYYVGQDKRDINSIAQDAATTSTIKGWYLADKDVSAIKINVSTYQGVVTLHGEADTKKSEMKAMKIAARAKGVTKVISKLTVIHEEPRQVAPEQTAPVQELPIREPASQVGDFIEELP
jgi:hyperosmotically inducible protein